MERLGSERMMLMRCRFLMKLTSESVQIELKNGECGTIRLVCGSILTGIF
jgi:small nuclear ribonucleoprotein (snRNP)-like protein